MRATPTESATASPGPADAYPHAADRALIPVSMGPDRGDAYFALTPDLTRHDGALYGGTGAAAAVMMMEAATQRDAVWVEWVLLDLRGDVASHGYGHGSFTAWSRDGALLATGSQTASMTHAFDADDPRMEEWRREVARAAAEGVTRD